MIRKPFRLFSIVIFLLALAIVLPSGLTFAMASVEFEPSPVESKTAPADRALSYRASLNKEYAHALEPSASQDPLIKYTPASKGIDVSPTTKLRAYPRSSDHVLNMLFLFSTSVSLISLSAGRHAPPTGRF